MIFSIDDDIIESITSQYTEIESSYKFDYVLHKISSVEAHFSPPAIPKIWNFLIKNKKIISVEELIDEIKNDSSFSIDKIDGHSTDTILKARCFQFWTGFLRELDCIINFKRLDPGCSITKDVDSDLGNGGADFKYISSNGKGFDFAIKMKTSNEELSRQKRKRNKASDNVIPIFVKWNKENKDGLLKVEIDTIKDYISYAKYNK